MSQPVHPIVDVHLGLGSNQEPRRHIAIAINALRAQFGKVSVSPLYRSPAVGFDGQEFINGAAVIATDWSVGRLKRWITQLEDKYGRDRSLPKFSDRRLDIDILLYGKRSGCVDGLELPRDEILVYAHVLRPLADLAPDLVHPVSGRTLGWHWQHFSGENSLTAL